MELNDDQLRADKERACKLVEQAYERLREWHTDGIANIRIRTLTLIYTTDYDNEDGDPCESTVPTFETASPSLQSGILLGALWRQQGRIMGI